MTSDDEITNEEIARRLELAIGSMIEPTDARDHKGYRFTIRAMRRAEKRLRAVANERADFNRRSSPMTSDDELFDRLRTLRELQKKYDEDKSGVYFEPHEFVKLWDAFERLRVERDAERVAFGHILADIALELRCPAGNEAILAAAAQTRAERDAAIAERDEACETAKERRDEAVAARVQADKLAEALRPLIECSSIAYIDDIERARTALAAYNAWRKPGDGV